MEKREGRAGGLGGSRDPKGLTTIRGISSPSLFFHPPEGWLKVGRESPSESPLGEEGNPFLIL